MTATDPVLHPVLASDAYERMSRIATGSLLGEEQDAVFTRVCEVLRDATGTEVVGVLRLLPESGLLQLIDGVGWHDGTVGQAVVPARDDAQGAFCLEVAPSLVVADLAGETRFRVATLLTEHGARSGVSALIRARGTPFGVLWAFTTRLRDFSGREERLVSAAADLLSAVVRTRAREADLVRRGLRDVLTGLPNAPLFLDRLDQALCRTRRRGATVAVLYLDVDGFGAINERLGSHAGDQLLVDIGNRIRDVVRSDDTVARYESDAFAVACEGIPGPSEAMVIADRVRRALDALVASQGPKPTASIGVAVSSGAATPADVLLDYARSATAQAAMDGPGRVVLHER